MTTSFYGTRQQLYSLSFLLSLSASGKWCSWEKQARDCEWGDQRILYLFPEIPPRSGLVLQYRLNLGQNLGSQLR